MVKGLSSAAVVVPSVSVTRRINSIVPVFGAAMKIVKNGSVPKIVSSGRRNVAHVTMWYVNTLIHSMMKMVPIAKNVPAMSLHAAILVVTTLAPVHPSV